jgi:ubiquitin-protein ligase
MYVINTPKIKISEIKDCYEDSISFRKMKPDVVFSHKKPVLIDLPKGVTGTFISMKNNAISYYNPEDGLKNNVKIRDFFQIKGMEEMTFKKVRDVIIVCIDHGALTNQPFMDTSSRIIDVEKNMVIEFINRIEKSDLQTRLRFIQYSSNAKFLSSSIKNENVKTEIHSISANNEKSDLAKCLNKAYDFAEDAMQCYDSAKIRIVVFTAGTTDKEAKKIKPRDDITVDFVFLRAHSDNTYETYDNRQYVIANMTGGYFLAPKTNEQAMSIVDNEAFYNSMIRVGKYVPPDDRTIQRVFMDKFLMQGRIFKDELIDTIKYKLPSQSLSCRPLRPIRNVAEILSDEIIEKYPTIVEEIRKVAATQNLCYQVFLNESAPFCWRVILKGPLNSEYSKNYYYLWVMIPKQFPTLHPTIRFISPIYHLFVTEQGGLAPGLQAKLFELKSMDEILTELSNFLAMPPHILVSYSEENGGVYGSIARKKVYDECAMSGNDINVNQIVDDKIIAPKKSIEEWTNAWNIDNSPVEHRINFSRYIMVPSNILDPKTKQIMKLPVKTKDNVYQEKGDSDLPVDIEMLEYIKTWRTLTGYKD